MIVINQNTGNTVAFTLTQSATITNPTFLLEVINEELITKHYYILTGNTSNNKNRYDSYIINHPNDLNVSKGLHLYNVYQQNSETNTNPELSNGIIESGYFKVL